MAPSLAELQQQMRGAITQRSSSASLLKTLTDAAPRPAADRLAVYTQGYFLRLLECLASDFPATRRALGETNFRQLAADFFQKYPSSSPNISDAGGTLPAFSRAHALRRRYPYLSDLLTLEWTVLSSLYTDRLPALKRTAFQAIPTDAWSDARLILDPTVRLLQTAWAVDALWDKRRTPEPKRRQTARRRSRALLVFRDDDWVKVKVLDEPRWITLQRLSEGTTLGVVCEELPLQFPAQSLPVMDWFSHWMRAGIIKQIRFSQPDNSN